MEKQRAFLKWAGGKYTTMEHIHKVLPEADMLVEPFVGAGNVFLNTNFKKYLLADANRDLIHLYETLHKYGEQFIDDCEDLFQFNDNDKYYELRKEFNQSDYTYRRACIFVYLNRHGFNGLCRYNLKGWFNVAYGKYKKPYFPREEMRAFYKKTHECDVTFMCKRFEVTFYYVESMTGKQSIVVYCDPPYVPISPTANFTSYCVEGFRHADQLLLADCATQASVPVVVSNHDTDVTRQLYHGTDIVSFEIQRSISCVGDSRIKASELLASFKKDK